MAKQEQRKAGFFIEGWAAYVRGLKEAGEGLDDALRASFKDIAEEVAEDARARAEAGHPRARYPRSRPNQTQHWSDLVATIRAGATARTPHVTVGKAAVPWALGFEFGGGQKRTTRQFPPWRGNGEDAGYFLWPAVRSHREDVLESVDRALTEVLKTSYPDRVP